MTTNDKLPMTPARLAREIVYPLVTPSVVLSLLVIFVVAQIGWALASVFFAVAPPMGWLLVVLFLVVLLPVTSRFLMEVLDARIDGREPVALSTELFQRFAASWSLLPLVLIFLGAWLILELEDRFGTLTSLIVDILFSLLLPAILSVLAMTNSAVSALNPVSLYHLLRLCGASYMIIPVVNLGMSLVLLVLVDVGVPGFIMEFGMLYVIALTFSLTGAVVNASGATKHVGIHEPLAPTEEQVDAATERERKQILDHAYGLLSRGNRSGGLAHIESFIEEAAAPADEYRWFFDRMMRWEQPEPALDLGQYYLSYLLDAGDSAAALKLMSSCLHVKPTFKPLPEDRPRALELAETQGREDLVQPLKG